MTRHKFISENPYKILNISRKHFTKDLENILRDFEINNKIRITINLPICFHKLVETHKNKSKFIANIVNNFYHKVKYVGIVYNYFAEFVRASFVDYIINNKTIMDYLIKNTIYADTDKIYINGKKHIIIKKLDDYK